MNKKTNQPPVRKSIDGITRPDPVKRTIIKKTLLARLLTMFAVNKKYITYAAACVALMISFFVLLDAFNKNDSSNLSNAQIVVKVEELIPDLPNNELPTIATLEDVESIVKQDRFYEGAQNGDKILVYPKNKRAIIYNPSKNKIVKDGDVLIE